VRVSEVFRVRHAQSDDLAPILALVRGVKDAPFWDESIWRGVIERAGARGSSRSVLVAQSGSTVEPESFAGVAVADFVAGVGELETVIVAARYRRQGLGELLCLAAMRWAAERGAEEMQLEVRESNAAAVGLYRKLGFVEVGTRVRYYSNPVEDAVLMNASLPGAGKRLEL
jgi:[ribosomal protein S18]-alanine N-acetyltransferase